MKPGSWFCNSFFLIFEGLRWKSHNRGKPQQWVKGTPSSISSVSLMQLKLKMWSRPKEWSISDHIMPIGTGKGCYWNSRGSGRSLSCQHSTGWTRTLASWVMTCSLPIDCSAAAFLVERDFGPEDIGLKKCLIKGHPWQSWRAVVHCETVGSCYFSLLCGWIRCSVSFYLCVSSLPNFW